MCSRFYNYSSSHPWYFIETWGSCEDLNHIVLQHNYMNNHFGGKWEVMAEMRKFNNNINIMIKIEIEIKII